MANISLTDVVSNCTSFWNTVISQDGLVKNADGTLSVYMLNSNHVRTPQQVTKTCCDTLNSMTNEGYYYDLDAQKCRWSITNNTPVDDKPIKIVLNPTGNDGSIFHVDEEGNDTCSLLVDFDYLLKFDCEKLSELISPTTPVDPTVLARINALEAQIDNENVKLETIQSDLEIYKAEADSLTYSIVCDSFPVQDTTFITPIETSIAPSAKQIVPFNKTAFGSVAPFSFAAMTTKEVTYCLTEPSGLEAWAQILGNRYQRFLNADPTSYTCEDVIAIYNTSSPQVLIYECTTPFGTKTLVQNKITELEAEETLIRANILALQLEQNTIIATETNSCSNPMGILETMDVSVSIDVIEDNGTLTSVYNENIFPMIGIGQLYKYLAKTGDNSGLFVCGQPNSSETWASGCTGLNFSASTLQETNVNTCINIHDYFLNELYTESGYRDVTGGLTAFTTSLTPNVLSSDWLHYSSIITDESVINEIKNKKIKISLDINSSCGNFCVLIDNISLDKNCESVKRNDIIISKSPGFNLNRIIDNKKSWINNDSLVSRGFDIHNVNTGADIRQTNYDVNDERLVINTKEIDLDINTAKAIEYDVLTFIVDNPCLLTPICTPCVVDSKTFQFGSIFNFQFGSDYDFEFGASTGETCCIETCNPCIVNDNKNFQDDECFNFMDSDSYDFQDGNDSNEKRGLCCGDNTHYMQLLTTDLNTITTVDMFEIIVSSELIDAKNRQTISSYPTLKALYERYMNSTAYCSNNSSKFNYTNMDQFAGLIGDYWVDIIEQVIPATTIWGSVRVYTNTIFDQQKFKYRAYSSLFCDNQYPELKAIKGINCNDNEIEVITSVITQVDANGIPNKPTYTKCNNIYIVQMNSSSEFIGSVNFSNENGQGLNSVTEIII
jgi:hypothetical protein